MANPSPNQPSNAALGSPDHQPDPASGASPDPRINEAVYPPPLEFGSASDNPDPVHFGVDWRLLAPKESAVYQEALKSPKSADNAQSHQVLQILYDSFPGIE